MTTPTTPPARPAVVLLCGPSGAGKSRLAQVLHVHRGWPVIQLDHFYRDHDDPGMPRHPSLGIVDWDHPDSWNADAAEAALVSLVTTGRAVIPEYDISTSSRVGEGEVSAAPGDLLIAEGIFAAELVERLRQRGILHSAWCVANHRWVTMVRRLVRDVREHRKPPAVLVRRGWALMRAEPDVLASATRKGATVIDPGSLQRLLEADPAGTR
ncbi:uridine kinase family protein [Nostocoides jenkinsii]|uniref:Uridine kinase n=1 Tax=Nostocoides jenkinsii Ben 74 TaxID=1193518 RepID=A0A077M4G5_9MICO|nr:ATP-binding protein [Tetrasphaera jenkinsii]CCI52151.1 Uridine kinase [Tetrasphaera jenkinsii Ben 74]